MSWLHPHAALQPDSRLWQCLPRACSSVMLPFEKRFLNCRYTAFTVTVDAREGISTGISAADRARTLRLLADPAAQPGAFRRPGHICPLRCGTFSLSCRKWSRLHLKHKRGLLEICIGLGNGAMPLVNMYCNRRCLKCLCNVRLIPGNTALLNDFYKILIGAGCRSRPGGVLTRPGHTEAAVDLARLAGCQPAGAASYISSAFLLPTGL